MQVYQATLQHSVTLHGVGVHNGKSTIVTLHPAAEGSGIIFCCRDETGRKYRIPAQIAYSLPADLCTVLTEIPVDGKEIDAVVHAGRVETVEHLLAALSASGLDNVLVEVSGREIPILDGSAAPYIKAFAEAGHKQQAAKRRYIEIKKPVRVAAPKGDGFAEFLPNIGEAAMCFAVEIDFSVKVIGHQKLEFVLTPTYFAEHLAAARTFGFYEEAEQLRARGLAQGASFENSVVIDKKGQVLNPQALVSPDAFVRHKALDAVGDTALLGCPFIGVFRSFKGGHKLNSAAVRALLADKSAYIFTELH